MKTLAYCLLIAATAVLIYLPTLDYPFVFDDLINFQGSAGVRSTEAMRLPFEQASAAGVTNTMYHHYRVRALPYWSFALNYKLSGLDDPRLWRAVNIGLHVLMCWLVYAFTLGTLRWNSGARAEGDASDRGPAAMAHAEMPDLHSGGIDYSALALLSALIYAAHPLMTETVIYVSGRVGQMAAVCYLGAVASYVWWRVRGGWWRYFGALGLGLLGMYSKETVFTLPFMILLIEACYGQGQGRRRWLPAAAFMAMLPVIPITKMVVSASIGESLASATRLLTDTPRMHYLYTQATVIARYMRLMVWPSGQSADYDWPLYTSETPEVVVSASILLIALGAGIWLMRLGRRWRPVGLGVVGFFIALSVESSLFPIIVLIAEYRTYLPLAFMIPALVIGGAFLMEMAGANQRAMAAAGMAVVLVLSVATLKRSDVWQTRTAFWEDALRKSPGNLRAMFNLGNEYEVNGRAEDAIAIYKRLLDTSPRYQHAYHNLGQLYQRTGRLDEALAVYASALALDPSDARAHMHMAAIHERMGMTDSALAGYRRALGFDPAYDLARFRLGALLVRAGGHEEALQVLGPLVQKLPRHFNAYALMGRASLALGLKAEAAMYFQRALEIEPGYEDALSGLGRLR